MNTGFGGKLFTKLAALLIVVAFSVAAFGQKESGQLSGTVTDPQGAVVTGAKVNLVQEGSEGGRDTTTGESGQYAFTNVQPGIYKLSVEAKGFGLVTRRVQVTVGSRTELNLKVQVGVATEVVEIVSAQGVQVQTQTQTLSSVLSSQQVLELPTLTRDPYDLVGIANNVSENDPTGRGAGGFAINGQRAASTSILLDGGENVDFFTAAVGQSVPIDSVQEFRVTTSSFTADLGRAGGGVVNVTTKSGTNAFHGTVYEFYRGAGLVANTAENNANGVLKPNFVRNAFGFSIGGPVIKNKLHFFENTEWTRVRSSANLTRLIPTPQLLAASNVRTQDFFTAFGNLGTVTPGPVHTVAEVIAASGISNGSFFALPGATPAFQEVTYSTPASSGGGDPRNAYNSVSRVDYIINNKMSIYGRYALENLVFFEGSVSNSAYDGFNTGDKIRNQNASVTLTRSWTPRLVTATKFTYNRLNDFEPLGSAGVTPTLYMRTSATSLFGRRINLPGVLPFNPGSGLPFGGPQNLYQISSDLSWSRGKHLIQFGGGYIHTRDNRVFGAYETAAETLGSSLSTTTAGRNSLNNFVDGNLFNFSTAFDPAGKFPCPRPESNSFDAVVTSDCQIALPASPPRFGRNNRYNDINLYVQDTIKIHPRFTLNLGLRWEYYGVQHNHDPELDSNYYQGPGSNVQERIRNGSLQIAQDSPIGGLWGKRYGNFAPRVGFAWDVFGNGKTSLRGGYGLGYERNFGNVTFNVIQNPPNYGVLVFAQPTDAAVLQITTNNLGPLGVAGPPKSIPRTSTRNPLTNIHTAYSAFWSLAVEHQVMKDSVLSVEYSASNGYHLYTLENPNKAGAGVIYLGDDPAAVSPGGFPFVISQLNNQYAGLNTRGDSGFSRYHSLGVAFRSTNVMKTGWNLSANYTWSHAIDNLSSTFSESGNNFNLGLLDPFNSALDKGNADFDLRHRFSLGGIWDIPYFKHSSNWFLKNVAGGWEFAPIINIRAGAPFSVFDCSFANTACIRYIPSGAVDQGKQEQGAQVDANRFVYNTLPAAIEYFNPLLDANGFTTSDFGACTVPGQGATQNCPFPSGMTRRNAFTGPGFWNVTFAIHKNIQVTERVRLQARAEFFNAFNHSNLFLEGNTSGDNLSSSAPFTTTSCRGGIFGCGSSSDERRNIQLALKVIF